MRLTKFYHAYNWVLILVIGTGLFFTSCNKFEGPQTIPAYLKIDSLILLTNYPTQGSAAHEVVDVWIYVDDQQMGVFELPAEFPILASGKQKLEIRMGIKLNGISSTRVPYPFYQPLIYEDFEFFPDSTRDLGNIQTTYVDNMVFTWLEDFELYNSISIQETTISDTVIKQVSLEPTPEFRNYAGVISLTDEKSYYSAFTFSSFELPKQGTPVLLEMSFKTNNFLTVGLIPRGYDKQPLVILNESEEWNKIYINFGPKVTEYYNATDFLVYFETGKQSENTVAQIYLDNLKLVYRPN